MLEKQTFKYYVGSNNDAEDDVLFGDFLVMVVPENCDGTYREPGAGSTQGEIGMGFAEIVPDNWL